MSKVEFLQMNPEYPSDKYWDQQLIKDSLPGSDDSDGSAIVIIPGAYQADYVGQINEHLSQYNRCLVIVSSDEEAKFPVDQLSHPQLTVWGSYMNDKYTVNRWLPIGYSPHSRHLPKKAPKKTMDWFFAGQITHPSRVNLVKVLENMDNGKLIKTEGFSQGIKPKEYMAEMMKAKYVPCPGGGVNIDSFRVYEALEAGCIPIAENIAFWDKLLPGHPFPAIDEWEHIPGIIADAEWNIVEVMQWWQTYKRQLKEDILQWTR